MIYSTQNRSFIHFQNVCPETMGHKTYREKRGGGIAYLNQYKRNSSTKVFISFLLTYSFH